MHLPEGKLPVGLLRELLAGGPAAPPELLLAPSVGEDACAIEIPAGALVVSTDPITLTGAEVGAHAVVINANDVAVTGARPRWFLAAVLLPPGTSEKEVRELFGAIREALAGLGAVLVGGHSEITGAVRQPLVVGQMLGHCPPTRVVRTGGVRAGDVLVQVGRAPVEGAAVLAAQCTDELRALAPELCSAARGALRTPGISVVEPALLAAELGATALHDPTEGGLATGLRELAEASGLELRVESEAVLWFEPGVALCRALGADPWGALASGALLAAFPPARAGEALRALERAGHAAAAIGRARAGAARVVGADGRALPEFERDEVARVLESRRARREGGAQRESGAQRENG